MSQKELKKNLTDFQLKYLEFQQKILFILEILSCNSHPKTDFHLLRKCINSGIVATFLITCILNFFHEIKRKTALEITITLITCAGVSQILCNTVVIIFSTEKIKNLIDWIREIHEDISWINLGCFVEKRLQLCFWWTTTAMKIFTLLGLPAVQFMVLGYYLTDNLVFRIPSLSRTLQFLWQFIALTGSSILFVTTDCIIMFLGIYFITIINIFLDSIEKLDNEDFIMSSKRHLCHYHEKHLQIVQKLKEFDKIFRMVEIVQMGSCLPLIVGTLYVVRLYPSLLNIYIMLCTIIIQFFIICLFGEFIHSKTEEIFTKFYLTKWYKMSQEDKMILLMLMKLTIKPFSLKAAGMYDINMKSFVEVTKFSFSFCAILFAFK
uniref:Odorant receptor n=1 Tax=Phlebotomus papatasi TaxID=29031 RepID=A0A3F2ZEJ8_PHLPP